MAIGDNVFDVAPREGYGSSFILGENPALQHLVRQDELQKQRDYEEQKMFAQELAKVSTQSGRALPNHKLELDNQYKDFIGSYAKTGGKIKVGSPEYVDMQSKLQSMKSNAALAQVYNDHYGKTMEDVNQAIKAGKPYDPKSVKAYQDYITKTNLNEINPSAIPQLKESFNINAFDQKVLPQIKSTDVWGEMKPSKIAGYVERKGMKTYDPSSYSENVLNDPQAKQFFTDQFVSSVNNNLIDPSLGITKGNLKNPNSDEVKRLLELDKTIQSQNIDAAKTPEIYQNLAVKNMAEHWFEAKKLDSELKPETMSNKEWDIAHRASNEDKKVKPFVLQQENMGDTDPAGNELFGNVTNKRRVFVRENGEGDNKNRVFNANSGGVAYLDDNNKVHHAISGKSSITGKIISFVGGDNGQVYAEINGKSKTNYEIYKENPKDYTVTIQGNSYVVKDAQNGETIRKMTKSEASQKPEMNYYVPAKDVDGELHGEYKQQNSQNDLLNDLSNYFPQHYKSNQPSSKTAKTVEISEEEFDKLPKGAVFKRNGKTFIKQ